MLTHPPHFLLPSPAVRSGTATGRRSRAANDRATARTARATSPTRRESDLRRTRTRRRPPHLPCYCKFRDLPASRVRSRFFALVFPLPAPPRRSPDACYATHPPVRLSAHLLLLLLCHARARVSPSPSSSTNSRKARPEAASLFLFLFHAPRVSAHCQHLRPLWPRSVPTSSSHLHRVASCLRFVMESAARRRRLSLVIPINPHHTHHTAHRMSYSRRTKIAGRGGADPTSFGGGGE